VTTVDWVAVVTAAVAAPLATWIAFLLREVEDLRGWREWDANELTTLRKRNVRLEQENADLEMAIRRGGFLN